MNFFFVKNNRRGFTLIELLVVVAIIGVLASVVLVSLNSARAKGTDAAIRSNLKTIQNQAAIYYSENGSYGPYDQTWCAWGYPGTVFNDASIAKALAQLISITGAPDGSLTRCAVCGSAGGHVSCTPSVPDSFAIAIPLKTGGIVGDSIPDAWCVDGYGNSKSYAYTAGQTLSWAINFNLAKCN